jgi:hypothetical protein
MNVKFIFEEGKIGNTTIQTTADAKMNQVLDSLKNKINSDNKIKDLNDYYIFVCNDKIIDKNSTVEQIRENPFDTEIIIKVFLRSKIMKCPIHKGDTCFIRIENYGLKFFGCRKKHDPEIKSFDDYEDSQKINYNKIICQKCRKTQKSDRREFYECLKCTIDFKKSIYYCEDCGQNHAQGSGQVHNIVRYSEKNYKCLLHNNDFSSYCDKCNCDLCNKCEKIHTGQNHKVIRYDTKIPEIKKIEDELTEIKKKIARAKINIIQLKEMIDGAENALDSYYNIANDLIEKYKRFNKDLRNYHVISNINSLTTSNAKVMKDLDTILNGDKTKSDYLKQYETLINIYISAKENYLHGPAAENAIPAYMTYQKNLYNIDDNNANNKANIIEKVLQTEEDAIKINKRGHNIANKNKK